MLLSFLVLLLLSGFLHSYGNPLEARPSADFKTEAATPSDSLSRVMSGARKLGHGPGRSLPSSSGNRVISVMDFGAKGDGSSDDTKAFADAWTAACSSAAAVTVPVGKSYLLRPVTFSGPCKSDVTVMIKGTIVASPNRSDWSGTNRMRWITFDGVKNLKVEGGGSFNGNGQIWWKNSCKINKFLQCTDAPTAVTFNSCNNLDVHNLKFKDSQQMHVAFQRCSNVRVSNLVISAPGTSPNTDGIHVSGTTKIHISNCVIQTGKNGARDTVSDVFVDTAQLEGTTNGVRIKTWQGGKGYAKKIIFENVFMKNVENPIIIDQNYCDSAKACSGKKSAVAISGVTYKNITGTSATSVAMEFDCSKSVPCRGIVLQDINLALARGGSAKSICNNVHLTESGIGSSSLMSRAGRFRFGRPRRSLLASWSNVINVDDYGAKGDGATDDSGAFRNAWEAACSASAAVTLLVPGAKTYLLKPVTFSGSCKSAIIVEVQGTILASSDLSDWSGTNRRHWIIFDRVDSLSVEGGGTFNGNGQIWWKNSCKINKSLAVTFHSCSGLKVDNLEFKDSQQMHVVFDGCTNVEASNLVVSAPGTSPNTDGIHVSGTTNIHIDSCVIGTGDDCISIVSGSQYVYATNIHCGPGHGISIGSLGANGSVDTVSDVLVDTAQLDGSTNGVRIKSWQGGKGYARNITYRNVFMKNVDNPIIITQFYCDSTKACSEQPSAVAISGITYQNITGTSATSVAIDFDCSNTVACSGIVLQDIMLSLAGGGSAKSTCNNAKLSTYGTVVPSACSS
ncbi:hypothetical protein Taro_047235 [Colocasia esculenta]|uniref:endo-polygalacturonase n=1 Tax=Colocasia esculenta TaxID=4460 RepID=A0A843X0F8_COLES|nr:hypothetical protein [Colocasia esculenta]